MSALRRFFLRLLGFFRSGHAEADLAREIRAHLQLLEDTFRAQGMSAEDARLAAHRAFGGQVEQTKERQRDERSFRVLDQSWLDVKLALRMLVRYPGLTIVGVLGMSIAIAISAGAFSIVDGLLYPTLPLDDGDRIVSIQNWDVAKNTPDRRILHDFVTWRDELTSIDNLGAFRQVGRNLIATGTPPEVVPVVEISASAFRVTRVAPLLGRYLLDDDEQARAAPVVVIGHDVWQTRFFSDPNIVGRPLQLGSTTYSIVGVMPEGFAFPVNHQFWVPFAADPTKYERGKGPEIMVFGRLAQNATLETARTELTTIGLRFATSFPATHEQLRPQVLSYTYPFSDMDDPENALALRIIQYLVSILLGIVCTNVAILVYARTATRHAEIAVRSALGAGRRRIVAQLFIEALALAGVAAALAVVIVAIALREIDAALVHIIGQLPFWIDFTLSAGAVFYIFVLAIVAAAIVGVVPALKATGSHVQKGLKDMSAGGGAGMRLGSTWTALIVTQVAIAVALLPTAVYHAWDATAYGLTDHGFPADEILTAQLVMDLTVSSNAPAGTKDAAFRSRFADRQVEVVRQLSAEPHVSGVTGALHLIGQEATAWIEVEGVQMPTESADYGVQVGSSAGHGIRLNRVDLEWFDVFDVPFIAGRRLSNADASTGATAVVVNRHFARDILHDDSAMGRRFRYVGLSVDAEPDSVDLLRWYEIVGIVGDVPAHAEPGMVNAKVYHAAIAGQFYPITIAMRVRGADPLTLSGRLREISASVDPNLQLRRVMRMGDFLRQDLAMFRVIAGVLVLLTLSVVVLSAAGIYALMSCTVEQRRKEIGIRAALGADPRRILGAILGRALGQIGIGLFIGLAVAGVLERLTGGELMGAQGAVVLPVVSTLMVTVGLVAAMGPARRGLTIQLTEALRED